MRIFSRFIGPLLVMLGIMIIGATILMNFGIETQTAFALSAAMTLITAIVFVLLQGIDPYRDRRAGLPIALSSAGKAVEDISDLEVVRKGHYRGRRLHHLVDGSVIGETRFGWRQFSNFEDFQGYVDRR